MRGLLKSKAGFTVIEVMVAVLLSGIIITVVYQIMTVSSKTNNAANEQIVASNALDSTMETIRQSVMSATEVEICNAQTASPEDDEDVIKCIDNTIYYDDRKISDAKEIGVASVELEFHSKGTDDNILSISLVAKDGDGAILNGKSRSIELYLHSIGGNGKGEIKKSGDGDNCIIFSSLEPTE